MCHRAAAAPADARRGAPSPLTPPLSVLAGCRAAASPLTWRGGRAASRGSRCTSRRSSRPPAHARRPHRLVERLPRLRSCSVVMRDVRRRARRACPSEALGVLLWRSQEVDHRAISPGMTRHHSAGPLPPQVDVRRAARGRLVVGAVERARDVALVRSRRREKSAKMSLARSLAQAGALDVLPEHRVATCYRRRRSRRRPTTRPRGVLAGAAGARAVTSASGFSCARATSSACRGLARSSVRYSAMPPS